MSAAWVKPSARTSVNNRRSERQHVVLPARLSWKDQRGVPRFASVVTRNLSETGAFVECQSPVTISRLRLVHFQLERDVREADGLPAPMRQGRLLAAVYRVIPPTRAGGRQGLALRLMVDPRRLARPVVGAAADAAPLDLVASAATAPETSALRA